MKGFDDGENLQAENERLKIGLDELVKLQSHYARLLNNYDGGERTEFKTADEWLARLQELGRFF